MKYKKIIALGMVGLVGVLGLAGCTTQADIDAQIADAKLSAYKQGQASVDVTVDNDGVVAQAITDKEKVDAEQDARDAQVLADAQKEIELLVAENEALAIDVQEQVVVDTATATGYEKDELSLNANLASLRLDDSDLPFLQDVEIDFDGENIDIHEEILLSNDVGIRTSIYDEEFEDNIYLTLEDSGAIEYRYVFDDALAIADVSRDEPLVINFMSNDIEIVIKSTIVLHSGISITRISRSNGYRCKISWRCKRKIQCPG